MRDRPFIEVTVDGQPVAGVFYSRLVSATLHDATGQDADTCELVLDDAGNTLAAPREGARLLVRFGYRDVGTWMMGLYTVESVSFEGGPQGETMTVSGRSADMRSDLKEPRSEHFDNETVGGVMRQLADRHGLEAAVSPELAAEPLPYIARIDQSTLDFATRIADRVGGLFSVKGGKLVLVKRGSGSATGKVVPALTIDRSQVSDWRVEGDPRPRYGVASTKWFDRKTGKIEIEEAETGQQGPDRRLRHVLSSRSEAKKAASAEAGRLSRATGSGSITLAGLPEVRAEMDVALTGFRAEINGRWRAASVEHRFDGSYTTTIELEAPEGGRKEGRK